MSLKQMCCWTTLYIYTMRPMINNMIELKGLVATKVLTMRLRNIYLEFIARTYESIMHACITKTSKSANRCLIWLLLLELLQIYYHSTMLNFVTMRFPFKWWVWWLNKGHAFAIKIDPLEFSLYSIRFSKISTIIFKLND